MELKNQSQIPTSKPSAAHPPVMVRKSSKHMSHDSNDRNARARFPSLTGNERCCRVNCITSSCGASLYFSLVEN